MKKKFTVIGKWPPEELTWKDWGIIALRILVLMLCIIGIPFGIALLVA